MRSESQRIKLEGLNPELKSPLVQEFEAGLHSRIIGQERAVRSVVSFYQVFHAGLAGEGRPLATLFFLGPTGAGKTRVVEAAAEVLFGGPNAMIKIDCAEYQHSHEIAKLIGSPPGYLGHRETLPLLTQENLDRFRTERDPFTLVLFDEIEKASEALWQLLLGILDKAALTLGDNRRVDFSQTMIFMTSNLGGKEINDLLTGGIGFAPPHRQALTEEVVDQKIYHTAIGAARRKFSPEFMNRIDKVVVFRSLRKDQLRQILDLELWAVQQRVCDSQVGCFTFTLTEEAKEFLLAEGADHRYGARHLKRVIERFVVNPFANLLATKQVMTGAVVVVDFDPRKRRLAFYRDESIESLARATLRRVGKMKEDHSRIAA